VKSGYCLGKRHLSFKLITGVSGKAEALKKPPLFDQAGRETSGRSDDTGRAGGGDGRWGAVEHEDAGGAERSATGDIQGCTAGGGDRWVAGRHSDGSSDEHTANSDGELWWSDWETRADTDQCG
jgi:hypothetical protein